MMAKMFYTLEEAKAALDKSEEEVKQYAREGRLREFRDGPRLMFKADQVEQLKSELASGGSTPDLGVSDSGGLIGLVDTTGASGTSITLSEADTGQSSVAGLGSLGGSASGIRLAGSGTGMNLAGSGVGMTPGDSGPGMSPSASGSGINLAKSDTGLAVDLGLSGSLGGVPSPGRPGAGSGLSGTAGGGRGGVNVFGPDDEAVDPSAQTNISGGIREQVNLEGVGSGSGLLDLTRESDDTSLGAVLDEIAPGAATGAGRRGLADTGVGGSGTGVANLSEDAAPARRATASAPVYVDRLDPMAPAFGGMALGGFAVLLYGMFVLISALVGTHPDAASTFAKTSPLLVTAYGLGVAIVFFVIGLGLGKATGARR
jgi:hypothetical protein